MEMIQVQAAISALYGSDTSEAARANTFLMEFTEKPAAWAVSIELLSAAVAPESASSLQYFSANTLYTKVRKHWHQLDPEHRDQLGGVILQLLRRSPSVSPPPGDGSPLPPALRYAPVVISRLCLALAAVAVRAPNGVEAYIREAFTLAQGRQSAATMTLSLQMIKILPQEVDGADLSRSRKLELQDQLRNYISSVLQALESVLAPAESEGMVGSAGRTAVAQKDVILAALDCLREWAKLGVSIGRLASDRPRLLDRIVRMLGGENGSTAGSAAGAGAGGRLGARANGDEAAAVLPTACAAGDVIMELMAVQEYPRPPARNAAAEAILNAIGKMSALFAAAIQMKDEESASTLCNCVVAFGHWEMPMVAGAEGKGLALVELLLSLSSCNLPRIPILTMDFWLELQDVPFSERHPALGRPVYVRLLDVLLSKCELPVGFISWDQWEGEDVDEDALTELREGAQGVKDVLVVIYYILRADYMSHVMERLRARPESWQALEVTLLAVSSVSKEIRDWMDTHATGQDAERAEDARRTRALVSALLNELLVNASLSSVSLILAAGCKLIGSFSTLLPGNLGGGGTAAGGAGSGAGGASATNGAEGGAEEVGNASGNSMLPLALGYLSAGLQQETSRHQAAISVRTIAASCERGIIADRRALDALLQTLEVATRAGADIEQRLTLTEASVRVLPALDTATGSAMLMRLLSPLLHVLAQGLQSPNADETAVAEALQQLAQAVRFLDIRDPPVVSPPASSSTVDRLRAVGRQIIAARSGAGAQPGSLGVEGNNRAHISTEFVGTLWPMVDAIPGRFGGSPEIIRQLFSLLGKMLLSWRAALAQQVHIPNLLKMIMDCYDERQYSYCLDMMTTTVEVYGGADESAVGHFRGMIVRASARTFSVVQAASRPGEVPQVIRAYFELLYRFLLFCPAALVGSPELDTALQLALACVGGLDMDRESARAVLFFVGQLAGRCMGQLDRYRGEVEAALAAHGEGLTRLMFAALAGASPSLLWPNLIDALYALLRNFAEPQHQGISQQWVFGALRDERVCAALGEEERKHVMDAILRLLSDSRSRFKALMLDLAKICHNEMTKDGLLAYFL